MADLRHITINGVTYDFVDDGKLSTSLKGTANGLAELDENGKVPSSQLPAFVDDVVEYADTEHFPLTGETGKIYVALDTNKTYRWSGSAYVEISPSLSLGETSATAYRGDRGAAAYAAAVTNKTGSVTENSTNLVTSGGVYTAMTAKSDKSATVSTVVYDSTNKKITKTINGTTSDVVAVSAIKADLGSFTWGALAGQS